MEIFVIYILCHFQHLVCNVDCIGLEVHTKYTILNKANSKIVENGVFICHFLSSKFCKKHSKFLNN